MFNHGTVPVDVEKVYEKSERLVAYPKIQSSIADYAFRYCCCGALRYLSRTAHMVLLTVSKNCFVIFGMELKGIRSNDTRRILIV